MENEKEKGQYGEGRQIDKPKLKTISEESKDTTHDAGQYQEKINDGVRTKRQDLDKEDSTSEVSPKTK